MSSMPGSDSATNSGGTAGFVPCNHLPFVLQGQSARLWLSRAMQQAIKLLLRGGVLKTRPREFQSIVCCRLQQVQLGGHLGQLELRRPKRGILR
ncbi:hypothetical protein SAMN05216308_101684 [Nitrosospira sp. Nsp13]|nr:hypothetical protein SAMN05216308_101684 [Nitrosospira sp. Nsp13]